jgi:imidazolonepropionase
MAVDLLVHPIGELASPYSKKLPAHGDQMSQIMRIKNGALAVKDGVIVACGQADEVLSEIDTNTSTKIIDATDKLITPGFVDPHTHLVFAGNRANEFAMRCQGKTYEQIAKAGGGIVASMNATRKSNLSELIELAMIRLTNMLKFGTTTAEIKTGYGLDKESEINMLNTIVQLSRMQPLELIPTFMPAHAFPPGVEQEAYINEIVSDMLPLARKTIDKMDSNNKNKMPFFTDVFCDQGYFSVSQTRNILEAAMKLGFGLKIHSDEFVNLGATKLGIELQAASIDHLLNISDDEIDSLAKSNTVGVLLPGTSFFLNLNAHAPARKMIDKGAAIALGSDFNPGSCHIYSLQFIFGLACLYLKMTTEEVLTALTVNAAYAIGVGDRIGQLMPNYQADFLIFNLRSLEEIPYNLAANSVYQTYKRGQLVYDSFSVHHQ